VAHGWEHLKNAASLYSTGLNMFSPSKHGFHVFLNGLKMGLKKHMDLCLFPIELPKNGVELVFTQRCGLKHQQSTILWRFEHPKPEFHHQMGLDLSVKSWTSA
jgi:hypothetical protein